MSQQDPAPFDSFGWELGFWEVLVNLPAESHLGHLQLAEGRAKFEQSLNAVGQVWKWSSFGLMLWVMLLLFFFPL